MTTQQSVVTPERYAQGRTWDEYLDYVGTPENLARNMPNGKPRDDNSERMRRNERETALKPEHVQALRALPKLRVLALGEEWCPDVFRGMPVVAKLCEAAGWELRIFPRDDNNGDIMAEFLNKKDGNEYQSIPVIVLYTQDLGYIGHWIERPAIANDYYERLQKTFTRREDESEDQMKARIRQAYSAIQTSDDWADWRHESVREILAIAKQAPGA